MLKIFLLSDLVEKKRSQPAIRLIFNNMEVKLLVLTRKNIIAVRTIADKNSLEFRL
jgi:hypothetical protein